MPSYLAAMMLAIGLNNPIPPLTDAKGFDACVAAVNAGPEKGGDSDYLHCDEGYDPYLLLYPEEREEEEVRVVYIDITHANFIHLTGAFK